NMEELIGIETQFNKNKGVIGSASLILGWATSVAYLNRQYDGGYRQFREVNRHFRSKNRHYLLKYRQHGRINRHRDTIQQE
ncbi:hypothetical protein, partial [Sporosarcina sp. SAFN-010]|uniref:hypothetical protein n=1 Tax=Sporosarcina sp. SAFN-010 TaxID=3387273 RepID=UPI003F813431